MRIADKGLFPWLLWALFAWNGRIRRLPYAGGLICLVIILTAYTWLVGMIYARWIVIPPDGVAPDVEYIVFLLRSGAVSRFTMLPISVMAIMLDAKRLRSLGAWPWLCIVITLMNIARPELKGMAEIAGVISLIYQLILLLLPPKDAARPLNQRPLQYPGKGSGPRRLRGNELSNWRVISSGRRSADKQGNPES